MLKDLKRVVITGMGAITPLGNSVDECWKNIIAGKNGVAFITKFDTTHFKTKFTAQVKGFDTAVYFEKNEARKYDLFTQYAVAGRPIIAAYAEAFTANRYIGVADLFQLQ